MAHFNFFVPLAVRDLQSRTPIKGFVILIRTLLLYDFLGRRLKTLSVPNGPQTINISSLPAGAYPLQLITNNGQLFNQRFVKAN